MKMTRLSRLLLGGLLAWFGVQTSILAAGPPCLKGFITEIRRAADDVARADEIFARVFAFSDEGTRGATVSVQYLGGDRFVTLFDNLDNLASKGLNPFTKDDEVFEVIVGLSDARIKGTTSMVGNLASESEVASQGSVFTLFVSKKASGNGTNYAAIAEFEMNRPGIGGVNRRVDLVEISGVEHECKNWSTAVTAGDGRLNDYATREFPSDIFKHGAAGGGGFNAYKLDLPDIIDTPDQLLTIKNALLEQFDTQAVKDALGETQAGLAKIAFSNAWDARLIPQFHAFPR